MKKNLFLVALAALAFAACSDDLAEAPPVVTPAPEARQVPIEFNSSSSSTITRSNYTGEVAADMLGHHFVVTGYKGSQTLWNASDNSKVFDNFLVEWRENSAYTTESNTRNWEYVGLAPIKHATDNGVTRQAVKYWDYTKSQYDFIAWSTGNVPVAYDATDYLPGSNVLVSSINPATAFGATGKAFTMQGRAADLSQCYIADLVTVTKASGNYGKPVTLTFRSLGTKVRIGIYETIPGYSVRDVEFYSAARSNDAQASRAKLFTTTANDIFTEGTYTVYYNTVDNTASEDNNQAHISFVGTGTQETVVDWGSMNYSIAEDAEKTTGAVFLGRSSNTATFAGDPEKNYYEFYLPNELGTNLNLRVNYTLEAIDGTGEIIHVYGATAQIPAVYAQWQPGFAYTYLFKISDKTNGYTGSAYDPTNPDIVDPLNPAGLYPITFDAVVVNSEDPGSTQETITTVTVPSITTYQKGSAVVNNDEYRATSDIFITVSDGDALQDLSTKGALYMIPEGYTEADVIDAMQMQDEYNRWSGGFLARNGMTVNNAYSWPVDQVEFGADGNAIPVGTNKARRFAPTSGTTYAFVYTKTAPTSDPTPKYVECNWWSLPVGALYRYAYQNATAGDVQEGVAYFASETSGQIDVFLGQNVKGLKVRTGEGTAASPYVYTEASGYAVSGTTANPTVYCYGVTNKVAHNVAHGNPTAQGLYEASGDSYVATSDTAPVVGKAYYYKETDGTYTFCVMLPEQADGYKVLNKASYVHVPSTEPIPLTGVTYFDRYDQNDGEYYAKIIKVQ